MICLLLMGSSIPSGVIKRGVLEDLLDMEFHGFLLPSLIAEG